MTWCAVPEQYADRFLQSLNLTPTGKTDDCPQALASTARMDNGWRILVYNECGCPLLEEDDLRRLSADHEVLLCNIEEHCMFSSAEVWSGGQRKWWISHEGENGPKGLTAEGALPESFAAIRAKMEQAQLEAGGDDAGVDYIFEIPLEVARSIVAFKHDEDSPGVINSEYAVLSVPTSLPQRQPQPLEPYPFPPLERPKKSRGGIFGWFKK